MKYERAPKTNLNVTEAAQRRFTVAIFFTKRRSCTAILSVNGAHKRLVEQTTKDVYEQTQYWPENLAGELVKRVQAG